MSLEDERLVEEALARRFVDLDPMTLLSIASVAVDALQRAERLREPCPR